MITITSWIRTNYSIYKKKVNESLQHLKGDLNRFLQFVKKIKYFCYMDDYQKYITINPDIRFGKPCINNTRIAVVDILQWLASGMTYEEIMEEFPSIKKVHILAALAFAANRENVTKISAA